MGGLQDPVEQQSPDLSERKGIAKAFCLSDGLKSHRNKSGPFHVDGTKGSDISLQNSTLPNPDSFRSNTNSLETSGSISR